MCLKTDLIELTITENGDTMNISEIRYINKLIEIIYV